MKKLMVIFALLFALSAPQACSANPNNSAVVGDVVQESVDNFKGGEYFNDTSAVTEDAQDFVQWCGDLEDVATSVGLPEKPDPTTLLTAKQQWMLGFREYSPIRTWQHYLIDSNMWRRARSTSINAWMGRDPYSDY